MRMLWRYATAVIAAALIPVLSTFSTADAAARCFPDGFLFGSATAAYQVEGGWNETGRTPSIWDDFCRDRPELQCANVADDFLHRYKEDIQLMVATGLQTFRFSISWSRVMNFNSTTQRMQVNPPGVAFYHELIDELLLNNITPVLTLYHWDLPSELHTQLDPPGWLNRDIIDHFVEYAELMYFEYGSKVTLWSTFNEPLSFTSHGYGNGHEAPGFTGSATMAYTATHHVLLSHGRAVQRFRHLKNSGVLNERARISIVLNIDIGYPLNASDPMDIAAADRKMQFGLNWFSTPIVKGEYPKVMRERAGKNLPEFTKEEAAMLTGSYDLFMLNHYSSKLVTDCSSSHSTVKCSALSPGWERDMGIDESRAPENARLSSKDTNGNYNCKWFTGYPKGYMDTIKWMHNQNTTAEILLTENGWCGNEEVDNQDQLWYFQTYLEQVYKAITEEKIPIIGYTAWSFMDNYEWGSFKPRFGLYYVNFTAQTGSKEGYTPKKTQLARIPRTAARWFTQVAKSNCLDISVQPTTEDAVMMQENVPTPPSFPASADVSQWSLCMVAAVMGLIFVVARRTSYNLATGGARIFGTKPNSEKTPLLGHME